MHSQIYINSKRSIATLYFLFVVFDSLFLISLAKLFKISHFLINNEAVIPTYFQQVSTSCTIFTL